MPNPSNDDVAKALEQLAAGQADEPHAPSDDVSHVTPPAASAPQPPPLARTVVPARAPGPKAVPQPRPVAGRAASASGAASRPLQPPGSAPPPAPRPPGANVSASPSAATPARPAAARPASLGTARPAAPALPQQAAQPIETEVIDDDDRVIVPAPSADVFMHHGSSAAVARASAHKSLSLRRTFIPILLTAGLILFALGVLRFLWQGNNPLLGLQPWLVAVMFVFAAALWALAAVNMLAVKHQLESHK